MGVCCTEESKDADESRSVDLVRVNCVPVLLLFSTPTEGVETSERHDTDDTDPEELLITDAATKGCDLARTKCDPAPVLYNTPTRGGGVDEVCKLANDGNPDDIEEYDGEETETDESVVQYVDSKTDE